VPLKLSDILQTASQVTRWYPLDGGIGFGRARISLLFRSVETRLPPNLLGWDVGTAEFIGDKIEAVGYTKTATIKVHTGGSSGKFGRDICTTTDQGTSWGTSQKDGTPIRFPVKYRYRSPLAFEFTPQGSRKPNGFATLWLQDLVDNENTSVDIPIWSTKHPARLLHNYVTEANAKELSNIDDLVEIGRLKFTGRFKAGMDEDHRQFVSDNDSRETQETWDACRAEGVRDNIVTKQLPPDTQKLHEESLIKERDVLRNMAPEDRKKWLSKDGTDWMKALGDNPEAIADEYLRRRTQNSAHLTHHDEDDEDYEDDDDSSDSGLHPADSIEEDHKQPTDSQEPQTNGTNSKKGPFKEYRDNKDGLHRKQRGLMQWKPARNVRFGKDEAKFAIQKVKKRLALDGREPDVETEV
jgi:hypothetical protein